MTSHVLSEISGGVLTLTLNRPEKKNALTRAMYQALADGIDAADADPDIRCVVIQANGDMFTAGNDLADFAAVNRGDPAADAAREKGNPLLNTLERAKTPIVAAVNGRAGSLAVQAHPGPARQGRHVAAHPAGADRPPAQDGRRWPR